MDEQCGHSVDDFGAVNHPQLLPSHQGFFFVFFKVPSTCVTADDKRVSVLEASDLHFALSELSGPCPRILCKLSFFFFFF